MNPVFTTGHRRRAMRLAVFAVFFAMLVVAPGAMALDAVVDAVAVDAALTTDTTTATDTVVATDATVVDPAPAPAVVDPAPAPAVEPVAVVAAPVVAAPPAEPPPPPPPDPVAVADPAPAPAPAPAVSPAPDPTASAVTEPTPAAPQEVIVLVLDAPAVVAGAEATTTATLISADSGPVAPSGNQVDPGALAAPLMVGTSSQAPAVDTSLITPLVVPIVQTLGSGLLSPYVRPETFGTQLAVGGAVLSPVGVAPLPLPAHPPAQATRVAAESPFGFAAPPGGWSEEGAGVLALLMGFLPLGLPDGKSSLTQETQAALILMGALLIVLPFFAGPIRDRRRRGPRGFATLALRPG